MEDFKLHQLCSMLFLVAGAACGYRHSEGKVARNSASDSAAKAPAKYVRGCYFTNWSQYRPGLGKFTPQAYAPGLCTHILYAFLVVDDRFSARPSEWNDENSAGSIGQYEMVTNLKQVDAGIEAVLLSLGGWTFSQLASKPFRNMTKSRENRTQFVQSVVALLKKYNFDGLDIDWEFPELADRENYVALLRDLSEAFEHEALVSSNPRWLLTAAVSARPSEISSGYDVPSMAKYLDLVLLMTYDFHSPSKENRTGINAPLFARMEDESPYENLEGSAIYWVDKGMPKDKIVIGLASYGKGWTLSDPAFQSVGDFATNVSKRTPFIKEPGSIAYFEIRSFVDLSPFSIALPTLLDGNLSVIAKSLSDVGLSPRLNNNTTKHVLFHDQVCALLNHSAISHWDGESHTPYVVYSNQWFSYDNEASIAEKVKWLKSSGFRGAFLWALDMDDFSGQFCLSGEKYPLLTALADAMSSATRHASVGVSLLLAVPASVFLTLRL